MRSCVAHQSGRWCWFVAALGASIASAAAVAQVVVPPVAREDGQFGADVAALPDVDGDLMDDYAVAEPRIVYIDGRAPDVESDGRVHVYSGRTGSLLYTIERPRAHDLFGRSVAGVPDVDLDGRGDLIVAAYNAAYLYSGATGQLIRHITPPDPERFPTHFALSVAGIGDLDGDGRGDLLVNGVESYPELNADPEDPQSDDPQGGVVFVYSGATGEHVRTLRSPTGPVPFEAGNVASMARFGWSFAPVPDLNGDRVPDVAVGEPVPFFDPTDAPVGYRSKVYIFSGRTGRLTRTLSEPRGRSGTNFGLAVAGVDDLDGDHRGDVLVGAPMAAPGDSGVPTGLVYVFSGREGMFIRQIGPPQLQEHGRFGETVAGVPDANGDGYPDILIGAPGEGVGRPGRAYLHSGRSGLRLRGFVSGVRDPGGEFGDVIAVLSDTDGNARPEMLIGAPLEDQGPDIADSGRVYVERIEHQGVVDQDPLTIWSPEPRDMGFFGEALAALDDLDGDDVADLAVGEPSRIEGRHVFDRDDGRVHIVSGATAQTLGTIVGPANTGFGAAIASLEDVDGDGVGDIAIAAPGAINDRLSTGRVHLYSGATLQHLRTIGTGYLPANSSFASDVRSAGDLDGDGRGDLAVAAAVQLRPEYAFRESRLYLYSGATGRLIRKLGPEEGIAAVGPFAGVGDLNADGNDDLVVVDTRAVRLGGGRYEPRAYLVSGRSGTLLRAFRGTPFGDSQHRFVSLGQFISTMPDQDGDGRPELMLGDVDRSTSPARPVIRVYSPLTSRLLWSVTPAETGVELGTMQPGPDLDADRRPDIVALVRGPYLAVPTPRSASVRVISSATGRTVRQWTTPVADPMNAAPSALAVLPDAVGDGDSLPGVAISVPEERSGNNYSVGKVYLYRP